MYIAHSSPDSKKPHHSLKAHTKEVMGMVTRFTERFDPFTIALVSALMHDQGKKSKPFRVYIQSVNKTRGSVQHAIGGAIALYSLEKQHPLLVQFISLIVTGHHSGLPDYTSLNDKIRDAPKELKEIVPLVEEELKQAAELLAHAEEKMNHIPKTIDRYWYFSTLIRFCFSSLIDADWLSAEHYFMPEKSSVRAYQPPQMAAFLPKLERYMKTLAEKSVPSYLRTVRDQVYNAATEAGLTQENFYTLHAPTGSGKTLASLSFALHHATKNNKRRVIFALPLTNVTEQTSQIYRTILGEEHLIEHHSHMEFEGSSEEAEKRQLATENWNRAFIITTTVQLFESLFSNRTSKARKLHRIADSIIVMDEYQKLPLHVLKPILSMLRILREQFGVTVLFMSATPLALEQSRLLPDVGTPLEILKNNRALFSTLHRVDFQLIDQPLTHHDVVTKMKDHSNVLCIVNTKKDAQHIFKHLRESKRNWDNIYHLYTTMCSVHRLQVIEEIKKRQTDPNNTESIAVVSTQLLEAGVDLNFDTVFRMHAPLDSIIQAAGRCNREAKQDKGTVYLFDLSENRMAGNFYAQATEETKNFLKRNGMAALENPKLCMQFFKKLYSSTGENGLDKYQIHGSKLLEFKQVAKEFNMIEDESTISVLCINYPGFPHKTYEQTEQSRHWFRIMQPYMIRLNEQALHTNDIKVENGVNIWQGHYDLEIGYPL
jgi:CRISPR-associated endonuclease/helicase Cas3